MILTARQPLVRFGVDERGLLWAPVALVVIAAALLLVGLTGEAAAAEALFPAKPPATQVTREVTLSEAAQAGAVKLGAKGGFTGDDVSLELEGKKFKGPITVTVREEFTVAESKTPAEREAIRDLIPYVAQQTEAELNRISGKTSSGDQVKFKLDWRYAEPEEETGSNFHQVLVVNPLKDLPEPDKGFRSETRGLGVPNTEGNEVEAVFNVNDLNAATMTHETLHLAGLDDRYTDVYRYQGHDYSLPQKGMAPTPLKEYLGSHKPPLPPPPAGRVRSKNIKGTKKCDVMGTGGNNPCRKLSQRDLNWFGKEAGTLVNAEPGETLLNKDASDQNLGIGFKTSVFAGPGETTVANGVSAYCIDHDHGIPFGSLFDLGPKATELPGYEAVGKLLTYNATQQTGLEDTPPGMQSAIWNQTDGTPLDSSGFTNEAKAIMASAGVTESAAGADLPRLDDPNAGSPTTGVVTASGEVMPTVPAEAIEAPESLRIDAAQLDPARFQAGHKLFTDVLLATNGNVEHLELTLQHKAGKRWKVVKQLKARNFEPGTTTLNLALGNLAAGSYRIVVSVSGQLGEAAATRNVPFTVKGGTAKKKHGTTKK